MAGSVGGLHVMRDRGLADNRLRIEERMAANFWPLDSMGFLPMPHEAPDRSRAVAIPEAAQRACWGATRPSSCQGAGARAGSEGVDGSILGR